jgi:large subunit ribosomal protein L29
MMKKKQLAELHTKGREELKKSLEELQTELTKLKTDLGAGKLKDVQQVKKKKRDLARIKTMIREKELEEK